MVQAAPSFVDGRAAPGFKCPAANRLCDCSHFAIAGRGDSGV